MAEACSGRLQPSMCFSHTVLREYGWRPEGLRYRGCAKFEGVTSTPRPLRPDPASRRWRRLRVWICPYLLNYYFCGPVHIQPCRFQSTPPHGGRQGPAGGNDRGGFVSIHAPAWGATTESHRCHRAVQVSIHPPAWGATGSGLRQ